MAKYQSPQRLSQAAFTLGAVVLTLVVLGLTSYHLWRLRSQVIENGLQNAAQLASSLEEHLTHTLSALEVNLIQQGERSFSPAAAEALTRNARYLRSISLIDANGYVLNSSVAANIGSRFDKSTLLPKANGPLALLRVGPLMDGRDISSAQPVAPDALAPPQSVIPVLRELASQSGGLATMVAALNPDYFLNYYDRHLDLAYGEVALMRMDGSLLLSTADRFKPNAPFDTAILALLNKSASGHLRQTTSEQKVLLSAYRVSHDFPVVLVVKLNQDRVLEGWLQEVRNTVIVVLSILTLALFCSTVYFLRLRRLRQEYDIRVQDLKNQKYALDQHAIVSITDTKGRITYANERFCAISGYSLEELVNQRHSMVKSGQHEPELYQDLWLSITQGQVWRGELCNSNKSGKLNWFDTTIIPLIGVEGQTQQYIAIRTDITQRKSIETSLVSAKAAAEQANEAKSQFLANMSHEIRTPMNGVLGMVGLLLDSDLNPEQKSYARNIAHSGEALMVLINDILDLSKIEAGHMEFEAQAFSIGVLVNSVTSVLQIKAEDKGIGFLVQVPPESQDAYIGDSLRIRQILFNLLGNAIKFTNQGEVSLRVESISNGLRFEIRDTGIGIPELALSKLFSKFVQADTSTTREFGGTGLGLVICKKLVEGMRGHIGVESTQGQGSLFWFELPIAMTAPLPDATRPQVVGPDAARLNPLSGASQDVAVDPVSILLVEDHPINQKLATVLLQRQGYHVDLAKDGAEAVMAAQSRAYDLILMDVQMPVMNGFEATQKIRAGTGPNKTTPIVALTANAMQSDKDACYEAGMNDFLTKPFSKEGLAQVLAPHLHRPAGPSDADIRSPAIRP
jgi:PAS domain S-box-containing protein